MLEAPKRVDEEIRDRRLEEIYLMNVLIYNSIKDVRFKVKDNISKYFKQSPSVLNRRLRTLENYIKKTYGTRDRKIFENLVKYYNTALVEEMYISEQAIGRLIDWKGLGFVDELPKIDAFNITNKVLSDRAITVRNSKQARQITDLIREGIEKGAGIEATTRKIDISLGYRNKGGEITKKARDMIEQGKLVNRNGHFYNSYRIGRTETVRVQSIQAKNNLDNLQNSGYKKSRLRMIAVVDSRTRPQSIEMNGQISRPDGKFKYPDGNYYFKGEQPRRWAINDRETTSTVFLDDEKGSVNYNDFKEFISMSDSRAKQLFGITSKKLGSIVE